MKKKSVPALAKKLKKLRGELHLTQKKVADKVHITEAAIEPMSLVTAIPSRRLWTGSPRCLA